MAKITMTIKELQEILKKVLEMETLTIQQDKDKKFLEFEFALEEAKEKDSYIEEKDSYTCSAFGKEQ